MNNTLKVISYNWKGLTVSKVPCIKELLLQCDVLLLEETWLFSNQFNVISKYFQECESVNICGMNEDIYCQGRPYGGCSIVYSNTLKVEPIYFENEKRVCGITITLPHSVLSIFNVYMPCDDNSTESFDMYNHVLSVISTYCVDNNVDVYMIGGDFNTSLFRNESRHTISLNKFVEKECLYFCCNHVVSNVDFTFFSSTGTQTLIDHFIITSNMSQCITMYDTLDIIDNISDHMPVLLVLSGISPLDTENVDNVVNVVSRNKPLWSVASDVDIDKYKLLLDCYLNSIHVPVESLECCDFNCTNVEHYNALQLFFNDLVQCCIKATDNSIPMSKQRAKQHTMPGWNLELSIAREQSLFWHNIWKSATNRRQDKLLPLCATHGITIMI